MSFLKNKQISKEFIAAMLVASVFCIQILFHPYTFDNEDVLGERVTQKLGAFVMLLCFSISALGLITWILTKYDMNKSPSKGGEVAVYFFLVAILILLSRVIHACHFWGI